MFQSCRMNPWKVEFSCTDVSGPRKCDHFESRYFNRSYSFPHLREHFKLLGTSLASLQRKLQPRTGWMNTFVRHCMYRKDLVKSTITALIACAPCSSPWTRARSSSCTRASGALGAEGPGREEEAGPGTRAQAVIVPDFSTCILRILIIFLIYI